MKFLVDECCEVDIVSLLRSEGHDVVYVPEYEPGAMDDQLLKKAFQENRILITEDKDFGELVYRMKKPAHGIILLRFETTDRSSRLIRLNELIKDHFASLSGNLVIIDPEKFRFRSLQ